MKKLKKILSVLSAVMVLSTCAAAVAYADETVTEPTEATEATDQMITDTNEIYDMINEFVENKEFPRVTVSTILVGYDFKVLVHIDGDEADNSIKTGICDFIKENNIDETKVIVYVVDTGRIDLKRLHKLKDVNGDEIVNVRDSTYIASRIAKGEELNEKADYNGDGKINVRDAAAIAHDLASGIFKF